MLKAITLIVSSRTLSKEKTRYVLFLIPIFVEFRISQYIEKTGN